MRIIRKTAGSKTYFLVSELDPSYHRAARDLGFVEADDGFGRAFETDTPHLAKIFARFASSAEEMILQTAGARPVPWDKALLNFLQRASAENVDWWLAGSAALAVRRIDLVPRDLDIITDSEGARRPVSEDTTSTGTHIGTSGTTAILSKIVEALPGVFP